MSDPEGDRQFVFPRVLMFPKTRSSGTSGLEEDKTNWFPEGPDVKCFVIFLNFQFNVLQQQQKNTL